MVVNGSTQRPKRNFECETLVVTSATSTQNHDLQKTPTNRSECHRSFHKSPSQRFCNQPNQLILLANKSWWSPQTIQTLSAAHPHRETAKVDIPDSPCRRRVECLQQVLALMLQWLSLVSPTSCRIHVNYLHWKLVYDYNWLYCNIYSILQHFYYLQVARDPAWVVSVQHDFGDLGLRGLHLWYPAPLGRPSGLQRWVVSVIEI